MSTTVTAAAARTIGFDTFADLLPDGCTVLSVRKDGPLLAVTFSDDLDAATVTEVTARMTSRDDADQAARATLRADRDALDAEDPLRRLYDYLLGGS